MNIYLAGPMTGLPLFNFPVFDAACAVLRNAGHSVSAPQEHDISMGFDPNKGEDPSPAMLAEMSKWDFQQVMYCDAIALLPGWRESKGTMIELAVAQRCGKKVFEVDYTVPGALREVDLELVQGCIPLPLGTRTTDSSCKITVLPNEGACGTGSI